MVIPGLMSPPGVHWWKSSDWYFPGRICRILHDIMFNYHIHVSNSLALSLFWARNDDWAGYREFKVIKSLDNGYWLRLSVTDTSLKTILHARSFKFMHPALDASSRDTRFLPNIAFQRHQIGYFQRFPYRPIVVFLWAHLWEIGKTHTVLKPWYQVSFVSFHVAKLWIKI